MFFSLSVKVLLPKLQTQVAHHKKINNKVAFKRRWVDLKIYLIKISDVGNLMDI